MRRILFLGLIVVALMATTGCSKKPTPGGPGLKQVNDAFLAAGFKLDTFQPADPAFFKAQSCTAGLLDGVETVVCDYGAPNGGTLGKKAGEDWVAQATTGAVLANGTTLLALADRAKADPNGKTIKRITQAYQQTR
jgi:hypothetical protein